MKFRNVKFAVGPRFVFQLKDSVARIFRRCGVCNVDSTQCKFFMFWNEKRCQEPLVDFSLNFHSCHRKRFLTPFLNPGYQESVKVLKRALQSDDVNVRANAAVALGKIGSKTALDALEEAREREKDEFVVHVVEHALKRIREGSTENAE